MNVAAENQRLADPKPLTVKEVFDLIREDLEKVEKEFCRQTVSNIHAITEIGQ